MQQFFSLQENLYPYLLVNIRSGTTFTRVDSKTEYRSVSPVGGSPLGLTFYHGVMRMLNLYGDPTESIQAAIEGDSSHIDFDVGDIYGGSYSGLGLPKQMLASSFAKLKDYESDKLAEKV